MCTSWHTDRYWSEPTRLRIPFSCSETVMLLTVRSGFPIVAAIWFCVAVGFVCTTRSTAISSKVQDLHFRGRLSAKFALWTAPFALWTSSLVSPSFQSMCNSRFRKLSRVRGQVLEPSIYNWEMARTARKHSDSGVYHVILRGVKRIIGDRFIDPKEWTNVPVPMTPLQSYWFFLI